MFCNVALVVAAIRRFVWALRTLLRPFAGMRALMLFDGDLLRCLVGAEGAFVRRYTSVHLTFVRVQVALRRGRVGAAVATVRPLASVCPPVNDEVDLLREAMAAVRALERLVTRMR